MTVSKRDYYEVLGISRTADVQEIKRAYRGLAVKYHPDRNPDDAHAEQMFKEATEAYKVLSDPEQRRVFDNYGHAGLEGSGFQGFSSVDEIFDSFDIFGSVLGDLFGLGGRGRGRGRGRQANRPVRGRNMRLRVPLTFREAFEGAEKELELTDQMPCEECQGRGAPPDAISTCPDCEGRGQRMRRTGMLTIGMPCTSCGGAGRVATRACEGCRGKGTIRRERRVTVAVPAGVDTGDSMGVPDQGEPGRNGGPRGDLIVVFEVEEHEFFRRDGTDLHCDLPISFLQAILGDKVTMPVMDGELAIPIGAGTQPGDTYRKRGRGAPDPNRGRRGDLLVHFRVVMPRRLTRAQKKGLKQISSLFENEPEV